MKLTVNSHHQLKESGRVVVLMLDSPTDPGGSGHSVPLAQKKILLILAWLFVVNFSHSVNDNMDPVSYYGKGAISPWLEKVNDIFRLVAFVISFPVANLLAEVVVGRYKFISFLLKVLWVLRIVGLGISVCEYCLQTRSVTSYMIGYYLIDIPTISLNGAFVAVTIPLGLDQIAGASTTNIIAYVVWYLWVIFSSYSIGEILVPIFYHCTSLQTMEVRIMMSLMSALLFSVALILDFCFHHKLVKEPVTVNPVSFIFKVLKYAAKHKYPVQRSAFTYCENEQPTRLDYGKSKYGGPFTTEQVEDVKTFWRILVVILVISMLHVPIISIFISCPLFEKQFRSDSLSNCIQQTFSGVFSPNSFIAYTMPLYELLIYPCLRNRGPSIFQSAGIGAAALIASSLYGIAVEAVRQVMSNGTTECLFTEDSSNTSTVVYDLLIANVLKSILGLAALLTYRSNIVLICAQAPYNMTSLLIGLSFAFQFLFGGFGEAISIPWSNKWFEVLQTSICGVWFYLTNLIMAILIALLLFLAIRWYKGRERDEITESQNMVEDVYYKYKNKK